MPLSRWTHLPLLGAVSVATALGFAGDAAVTRVEAGDVAPQDLDVASAIGGQLARADSGPAIERELYAARANRPIWVERDELRDAAAELLAAAAASGERGLDPERYPLESLRRLTRVCDEARLAHAEIRRRQLARCDRLLTRTYLALSRDLAVGRVRASSAGIAWHMPPRELDLAARVVEASTSGRVDETLAALEPRHRGYAELRQALAALRAIEGRGGWPALAETAKRFAADAKGAEKLRRRLAASEDAVESSAAAAGDVAAALRRFQLRHGLADTGEIDDPTLAALAVPAADRRRQVELNLERWRWLPESFGERYVLVNVPAYELELVDGGAPRLTMRVVVGKPDQPTPGLSEIIEGLELNPYWNVPPSIAENEIVPALAKNPEYLAEESMEIVGEGAAARIRQRPGPKNALGSLKFVLPNEHNIYLHDTPADALFGRRRRSLSHGCVRVERPLDLGAALLGGDPGTSRRWLEEEIAKGENRALRLPEPVPVHIVYWTAWVDAAGTLQFRPDPYGIDEKLERALAVAGAPRA